MIVPHLPPGIGTDETKSDALGPIAKPAVLFVSCDFRKGLWHSHFSG